MVSKLRFMEGQMASVMSALSNVRYTVRNNFFIIKISRIRSCWESGLVWQ